MEFDELKHEYVHNSNVYTSATTLLKKYGLSPDYGQIPAAVLQQAANRGKATHKALELYIGGDKSMLMYDEVKLVDKYIQTRGIDLTTSQSEQVVYDTVHLLAGTVDFTYNDGNEHVVADFKTTSTLHVDSVSWQLSLYNYMLCGGDIVQYYFNTLKVFHIRGGKLYIKDIPTISYDEIVALLEANLRNDPIFVYVKPNNIIQPSEEKLLLQVSMEIEQHENHIITLKLEQDKLLTKVKKNFVDNKEYTYNGADFTLKYRGPQSRESLDTKKVKEYLVKQGEKIEDYTKTTTTKDGVSIKINNILDNNPAPF